MQFLFRRRDQIPGTMHNLIVKNSDVCLHRNFSAHREPSFVLFVAVRIYSDNTDCKTIQRSDFTSRLKFCLTVLIAELFSEVILHISSQIMNSAKSFCICGGHLKILHIKFAYNYGVLYICKNVREIAWKICRDPYFSRCFCAVWRSQLCICKIPLQDWELTRWCAKSTKEPQI